MKLNDKGVCVCDKLVESSENFKFNKRDCDESLLSLSVSDHDRNRISNVLQRYHDKQIIKHHVHVKPSLGGPLVIILLNKSDENASLLTFQLMHGSFLVFPTLLNTTKTIDR